MPDTSSVSGPTVAARTAKRYKLMFSDSYRRDVSSKRRALVAEYVGGWMGGTIVADLRVGADTVIVVDVSRAVNVEVAEEYFCLCAHYVAGTFAAVG